MALRVPLLDSARLRGELGSAPSRSSVDALKELLDGMSRSDGLRTPPLDPQTCGPLHVRELRTGIGATP